MSELDVVFANMYFAAIAAGDVDPSRAPSAWRPLLRPRRNCGIARLQFALAGMNAHINRDLPQGIFQLFEAIGGGASSGVHAVEVLTPRVGMHRTFAARSSTCSTGPQDLLALDSSPQQRSTPCLRSSDALERGISLSAGTQHHFNVPY